MRRGEVYLNSINGSMEADELYDVIRDINYLDDRAKQEFSWLGKKRYERTKLFNLAEFEPLKYPNLILQCDLEIYNQAFEETLQYEEGSLVERVATYHRK